ncbi:phage tail protein I [Rhizobium herbae]|uniref:Phage tail P2-like protein n=1 Tax=Rhizobium herbae TaxID=508661 RepID=A0ABS4EWF2_9HYPH|nr:phage tail protein I [Rhizobium herbae]MBP1862131.1 phage tail P2-like protein [Rhizobium herbae]
MSDPFIPASLVPPGVNDQRGRDFAAALSNVLSSFSTSALLIQDPLTVDARLLPILTVELGMTEFMTPGLLETHVRELLARAPEIHAWTGTVYGTKRALGALGITVDWTQWWQTTPKGPHDTHTVIAYVNDHLTAGNDNLFSAATQYAVRRIIEATQRWSQEISFLLGIKFGNSAGLTSAVQNVAVVRPTAEAVPPVPNARAGLAAVIQSFVGVRRSADAAAPQTATRAGLAASLSSLSCVRAVMHVFLPPAALEPLPGGHAFVVDTPTGDKFVIDHGDRFIFSKVNP